MVKKTVTYTNFNDEEVTENHFFHLSQAELMELEASYEGGLSKALDRIVKEENPKDIIGMFKKLLIDSYGVKSPDGTRFIKNQTVREEFESSEAYSEIFMELVTQADEASAFVNGIIPKGLSAQLDKVGDKPQEPTQMPPRVLSRKEMAEMAPEKLQELLSTGKAVVSSE